MRRWILVCAASLAAFFAGSTAVWSQAGPGFGLSAGALDFEDGPAVFELGFEYRLAPWKLGLVPHAGLGVTSELAAFFYLGLWRAFPIAAHLSLIHISEPTRPFTLSRMPSSA